MIDRAKASDRGEFDGRPVYPDAECTTPALFGECSRCGQELSLNPYSRICHDCDSDELTAAEIHLEIGQHDDKE